MARNDCPKAWEGREELAAFLDWISDTHMRYPAPGFAGLDIGPFAACFDQQSARLEGLARLFWGVAFAVSGGVPPTRLDDMLSGLAAGVNPEHPGYWGPVGDFDQRAVEMAAIAALLIENPGVAARLGPEGEANLYRWLSGIHGVEMPANNWRFFRVFILKALAAAGQPIDAAELAGELDFLDSQYRGGGWYGDTRNACRDYYTAFAFHFYSLLYVRWFADAEPERCAVFVERARDFALRYRYWFDDGGAPVAYGRSLTYRFATSCFWPLLATVGHPELSTGAIRGLWARSMEWWLRDSRKVFDDLNRVTVGYGYPNVLMSESYNSPQSPLWALKSLFPLALGADDAFWRSAPEACPYPSGTLADRDGGFVIQRRGGAYMLAGAPASVELRNCVDKYMKFAYSSRHGFGVESVSWLRQGSLGDNILAFEKYGNWFRRESIQDSVVSDNALTTRWSPLPGCQVETRQEFTRDGEVRRHIVDLSEPLEFIASGYAADAFLPPGLAPTPDARGGEVQGATLYSAIEDADGRHGGGVAPLAPNTNLLHPQSATPFVRGTLPAGRSILNTVLRYGEKETHSNHKGAS